MAIKAPDLTRQPPRSPRVRIGGYVLLARMLDKGRATIAGKNGEYKFACPLDQRFLGFTGIEATALKRKLKAGKSDGEILEWINASSRKRRGAAEIAAWSAFQEQRGPTDPDSRIYFNDIHSKIAPNRGDVASWFDLLDLDDYVSFGGRP